MSKCQAYAARELKILEETIPGAIVTAFVEEIIALCHAVGISGQSGGSAHYTANAVAMTIAKLLLFNPLTPLTGEDSEWDDVSEQNNGVPLWQNNRESGVFKESDGKPYYVRAIVFNGNLSGTFHGGNVVRYLNGTIGSQQYIKSFPFEPKTFYVDVIERTNLDKDDIEHSNEEQILDYQLKDESQLQEVFEYYDPLINSNNY